MQRRGTMCSVRFLRAATAAGQRRRRVGGIRMPACPTARGPRGIVSGIVSRLPLQHAGVQSRTGTDEWRRLQHLLWAAPRLSSVATRSIGTSNPAELDNEPHVPVLMEQVLSSFRPVQLGVYLDGTLGAAGHACAVMAEHPELQTIVGIDQDPTALAIAERRLSAAAAARSETVDLKLVKSNFRDMGAVVESQGLASRGVDAILLDLGMSSMQVDSAERGFSFMNDGPLDMRMDPDGPVTAADIVNNWSEQQLGQIFRTYGEEKYWRQYARRICSAREMAPIMSTLQLSDALGPAIFQKGKGKKGKATHPATRVFQALRIAVNDELRVVEQVIPEAVRCLAPGGRLGIITFHSLEDRIVKKAFLAAAGRPPSELTGAEARLRLEMGPDEPAQVRLVSRKPMGPSDDEIATNPRSRSAKLRVVEKL